MPLAAHNISADRPADPDIVCCSVLQGRLELVRETAIDCLCLGDFSPDDSGFRNASARASMSLHPTGSVSLNIPPEPIGPSVPHTHSDSDFGAARPAASRLRLQGPDEMKSSIFCRDHAEGIASESENPRLPSSHCAPSVPSTLDPDDGVIPATYTF